MLPKIGNGVFIKGVMAGNILDDQLVPGGHGSEMPIEMNISIFDNEHVKVTITSHSQTQLTIRLNRRDLVYLLQCLDPKITVDDPHTKDPVVEVYTARDKYYELIGKEKKEHAERFNEEPAN